ncbi:MAG TPA: hypothetical protein VN578_20455 [Candidatus Binatia bacterium]|jgi:hypothetical protein|nr:hypothetical protein [Candidatus Binatia bacterium]
MLKAQLSHNGSPRAIRKLVVNLLGSASLVVGLGVGGAVLAGGHLMAADIEATLYPGQSANASVSVTLAALPPTADVLFSFDCTSSMYGVINTAKANAVSLMDSLEATGVDFHYGVASFMDYPGVYGSCGYSNYVDGFGLIPYGEPGDYPYLLSQGMTSNTTAVSGAINRLSLGGGSDFPEAYTRALYESYTDPNVMWRTGAKKVVVNFGDAVPHDCNLNEGIAGTGTNVFTTGGDPGRDGVLGTSDDLDLQTVLAAMASNHVVLLAARVSSGAFTDYYFNYWTNWTGRTGGKAFQSTNSTLINDLMHEITNSLTITCVSSLQVVAEPTAFSSWLATVPSAYGQTCSGDTRDFNLAVTVPAGTPGGDYAFTLRAVDDKGVGYLSRSVLIHVFPTLTLPMALNNSNLAWATDSGRPWFGQANVSHDGVASGRSYFIGDGQQTSLTTTTNGPGTLSFWWKVSSQTNADRLSFLSYGGGTTNLTAEISGETGWKQVSLLLPGGPQTLVWAYTKDVSQSAGLDAGFVDQVSYKTGPTLPFIITDPVSQLTTAGNPVTFSVLAGGTPRLAYQWRWNGNDIPGATSNGFTLPAPNGTDAGVYSVRVANPYGATNSANASLTVIPLILRGDNALGQAEPCLIATNPVAIAAGAYHTLVLLGDGTVLAWGENYDGQCNPPKGLADVVQVAGGGYHSLALRADRSVAAWGANDYHQCATPAGLSNVVAVAGGFWHSLALQEDGTVGAWGDNNYGQTAVPVGLKNVVAIAASGNHSLALRADGTVVAWGDNSDANGNFAGESMVPPNLNGVQAIGAGEYHSLAVRSNGTVVAWGDNSEGQCQAPANLTNAVAVVGGGKHSLAIKADASVAAWGNNWDGQCNYPTNLFNIAAMAAGEAHSVFLVGLCQPKLMRACHAGNQFSLVLSTYPGKNYVLEYTTSLKATTWTSTTMVRGNGGLQTLMDSAATNSPRFYRVRLW